MSVSSSDLVCYAALNRPQDDVSTAGGGIDADHRVAFTQLAAPHTLEALSSAGGDTTQVLTVVGRDSTKSRVTATVTLTGTSAAALSPLTTFERILTVSLSADTTGTVTLRVSSAGATVGTIPPGERGFDCSFINSVNSGTGTVRYSKQFWKNNSGTDALLSSQVVLTDDPQSSILIGVAAALNDTASIANRNTAPSGIAFVGTNTAQSVPGGMVPPGSAIGVWVDRKSTR